jgi:glucose/arabinose dehydrogenase
MNALTNPFKKAHAHPPTKISTPSANTMPSTKQAFVPVVLALAITLTPSCTLPPPDATPPPITTTAEFALVSFADGFVSPIAMEFPPDDTGRAFVVDQVGRVHIIHADGSRQNEPFLDLSDRMVTLSPFGDERGLLSLAFHPDYASNGRFFVYYTAPPDDDDPTGFNAENRVSEFTVSSADPNQADPTSERIIIDINQPLPNHNAGQIAFGPDGFLYIGTGDGGGANDTGPGHTPEIGNSQDKSIWLGKILRIDVDNGDPYAIPEDNPFVNDPNALPEIYAFGFRNPWRFSFDVPTNRLFVADVGQELFEEINLVEIGRNYGWNLREGAACFDPSNPSNPPDTCSPTDRDGDDLIDPIITYSQVDSQNQPIGIAVIGGYVYRGTALPELAGQYIFGDYSRSFFPPDGTIFIATESADTQWSLKEMTLINTPNNRLNRYVLAFAQDPDGEIYVLSSQTAGPTGSTGQIGRIAPAN